MELHRQAALLTAELVVVIACAALALPIPAQLPLLAMALISYKVRSLPWAPRFASAGVVWAVAAAMGVVALGLALVVTPALEARTGGLVAWTREAVVRGNPQMLVAAAVIISALTAATEVVMRGWILERIREQVAGAGRRASLLIAVGVTAAVEAMFTGSGAGWSALGAALVSAALSGLYLAAGRSLVAPIVARLTFELGVLALESLRLVN
jgi:membrane protease YdiL (CAAX protease family)